MLYFLKICLLLCQRAARFGVILNNSSSHSYSWPNSFTEVVQGRLHDFCQNIENGSYSPGIVNLNPPEIELVTYLDRMIPGFPQKLSLAAF